MPPTGEPAKPQTARSLAWLGQLRVLAQPQNLLTLTAAIVGFLVGVGGWAMIFGADDDDSLIGEFIAGLSLRGR